MMSNFRNHDLGILKKMVELFSLTTCRPNKLTLELSQAAAVHVYVPSHDASFCTGIHFQVYWEQWWLEEHSSCSLDIDDEFSRLLNALSTTRRAVPPGLLFYVHKIKEKTYTFRGNNKKTTSTAGQRKNMCLMFFLR